MNDNIIQFNGKEEEKDPLGEMVQFITELLAKPVAKRAEKIKDEGLRNAAMKFAESAAEVCAAINNRSEIQDEKDKENFDQCITVHSILVYNAVKPIISERAKIAKQEDK